MASLFNVFRSGFLLGFEHGSTGQRRRANWELTALRPLNWLPGVDSGSYLEGYQVGYTDGYRTRTILPHLGGQA